MKLTVNQVAEKLGVHGATVRDLIHKGLLTDLKVRENGKKKHFSLVDSKQVREFAKTYVRRGRVIKAEIQETKPENPIKGLMARLENIERKLDLIIKIWS